MQPRLIDPGTVPHDGVRSDTFHLLSPPLRAFLERLGRIGLIDPADTTHFLVDRADSLRACTTEERLGNALVQAGLLTPYQLQRARTGATHGLVLGNYRIRDRIGRGGMGTVYQAEHRLMKRQVAIKVLPVDDDCPAILKQRFYAEMRALAELSHPNIVFAFDAGEVPGDAGNPPLIYLVMELVEGGDLERHVLKAGVLGIAEACGYVCQAAAGLQAAHDRHLIHRDVKPSNLLRSAAGQVKLVDFGLARQFSSRLTDQRALLGSLEFMPPEQSFDPSLVGKEADLYGLGATLFWLLAGEGPYPAAANLAQALRALQQQDPRRLRALRPETPPALDELIAGLLDRNPANRPPSALAVLHALRPFTTPAPTLLEPTAGPLAVSRTALHDGGLFRVLVATDHAHGRALYRPLLERIGCVCSEVDDGSAVVQLADQCCFDLAVIDLDTATDKDRDLCGRLRTRAKHLKVVVVGRADEAGAPPRYPGADAYLTRGGERADLLSAVRLALQLKAAHDRADRLVEQARQANDQLEHSLQTRATDLREAHNALLFTLAKIAESRDGETPGHLRRMQRYTRTLAIEAARSPAWEGLVDQRFLEQLERCVPLHDIGKIGLPDDILLKPGTLTPTERTIVETHPLIGDQILEQLGKEYGTTLDFLNMARIVVRYHHERHDGKGYPDRLAGDAIPPAARVVAVADVYDALRRMRLYKPAMAHAAAVQIMLERSPGQFDPELARALSRCHPEFDAIYREIEE
ncbi:MAG: protein kinase [Gemmataceae bacterium]